MSEWTDADKAKWILEHGQPEYTWIYERVGEIVYRRPSPATGTELPPWMDRVGREEFQWSGKTWDYIDKDTYGDDFNE